jgi:molybdopterin-guanine dinucleotide biosynthesis protein A
MYDRNVENVTAFILAGGKSSRMGADKAFLELGGRTLLARALEMAGSVAQQVRAVGDKTKFAPFGIVVDDIYPECGPLGGIHAALMSTTTDFNLMLAVDLPFMRREFLELLLSEARRTKAMVTVARVAGFFQPLCAVYRKEFTEVAERSLQAGKNKIGSLFGEVNTRVIEEEELRKAGFAVELFRNLNTPEEWEYAKLEFGKRS